jgi:hypothetical protein
LGAHPDAAASRSLAPMRRRPSWPGRARRSTTPGISKKGPCA